LSAEALNDSGVALAAYKSALAQAPDDQARSTINQMINAMQTGAGGQAN
jgi:hypothetical protein